MWGLRMLQGQGADRLSGVKGGFRLKDRFRI